MHDRNYKQGKVIFLADNSATAARLRLLAPSLLQLLGQRGLDVTGMKVDVQPAARRHTQPVEEKSLLLSPSACGALARAAESLPDGALRQAVAALARRGTRR